MYKTDILRVLVGSRAHGLAREDSDWDYRGIYVARTRDLLALGVKNHKTSWAEGKEVDDTSQEIGHFLNLAIHSNPTVLEVLVAPVQEPKTVIGCELRGLFSALWSSEAVMYAFTGYAHNQHKKMMDNALAEHKQRKYGVAYIRVLWQGIRLILDEELPIDFLREPATIRTALVEIQQGKWSHGQIVDYAVQLRQDLMAGYYRSLPGHKADPDAVNEFLLRVRQQYW